MVGIPLLIDRLGKVLDSAVIPMGLVTGVKARFCILQSWRYSEWCLSWEDFLELRRNVYRWFLGRYDQREWCGSHPHLCRRDDCKR